MSKLFEEQLARIKSLNLTEDEKVEIALAMQMQQQNRDAISNLCVERDEVIEAIDKLNAENQRLLKRQIFLAEKGTA